MPRRALPVLLALLPALGAGAGAAATVRAGDASSPPGAERQPAAPDRIPTGPPFPRVHWHSSRALGLPSAGRLVRGVRLPPEGRDFFTWDPVRTRSPNRWWRRYGHDRLIRTLLRVLRAYRTEDPGAPRVGIGDLSRPGGGEFGARFGGLGHGSHQNGLDVDVYYPRLDGRERRAAHVGQVDFELAQDLVDGFVDAGARFVFVGPHTPLEGPPGVVERLVHHDDHLHVRIRSRPGGR